MTSEPEFKDTPVDRFTLASILTAAGKPHAGGDDLAEMNALWDQLAPRLASISDHEFDEWEGRLITATMNQPSAVLSRVSQLLSHLVGWRLRDV